MMQSVCNRNLDDGSHGPVTRRIEHQAFLPKANGSRAAHLNTEVITDGHRIRSLRWISGSVFFRVFFSQL